MKGYDDRMEDQAAMLRMGFYRTHQSLVQKPFTLQEFWPLPSDKKIEKTTLLPPTKEFIEQIRRSYNLK